MNKILFDGLMEGKHYQVELIENQIVMFEYNSDYASPWIPVYSIHTRHRILEEVLIKLATGNI